MGTEDIGNLLDQKCLNVEQSSLATEGRKATVVEKLVSQQQTDEFRSDYCENRYYI